MTGYYVYLTYGRNVYPSSKIMRHDPMNNIHKYITTVQCDNKKKNVLNNNMA